MFVEDENRLRYCLRFKRETVDEVFIRVEAIEYIRREFLKYWKEYDRLNFTNNYDMIERLYLRDDEKTYVEIAYDVGYTVRTLKRYREKFVSKANELVEKCRSILSEVQEDPPYSPII